uniref:RNase H type-1 domain-containing protein n=1 Tax=Lepeophtheirus salmonis TaxID=72036 RepID=A0A0K2SZW2_LEPSM
MNEKNIDLLWCKGHSDITGNEFADHLASRSTESKNQFTIGTPPSYIKKVIHDCFYQYWFDRIKKDQSMNHMHTILNKPKSKCIKLGREKL